MKEEITHENLIAMGFIAGKRHHKFSSKILDIYVYRLKVIDVAIHDVFVDNNATTIHDIQDLIRLFKQ